MTLQSLAPSVDPVPRRSPWPYGIILSFLALAAFDAVIVSLALNTSTAEIESNPYEAGLGFEHVLEAKRAVAEDKIDLKIAEVNGTLHLLLSGLESEASFTVDVRLLKPEAPELDVRETVRRDGPDIEYISPMLKRGLWLATVHAQSNSRSYQFGPEKVVIARRSESSS